MSNTDHSPGYMKSYMREWIKKNPEKWRAIRNRSEAKWRQNHKKVANERTKKHTLSVKLRVFLHYSPELKCARCGFSDMRALSIDHINGDGAKHREEINRAGSGLYYWLLKNNFPEGFQVLCMNCQFIKKHENKEFPKGRTPRGLIDV